MFGNAIFQIARSIKMSKADKMFEDLGYKRKEETEYVIFYFKGDASKDDLWEIIRVRKEKRLVDKEQDKFGNIVPLSVDEIKALVELYKELGWL